MKKITALLALGVILFASCSKSKDSAASGKTFEATIDGKSYVFNINSATLLRSAADNEKRLDIAGTSTDGSKRLIITLGEETSQGNGVSVKTYVLNPFPEDDPNTPNVDESLTTQGFTTYSTSLGNNNWLTDVYNENGSFQVTSCDETNKVISGTFHTDLVDFSTGTVTIKVTAGKIANVKYTVLN